MSPLVPTAVGFVLVLLRATAFVATAPLLGTRVVPVRIRLGLALALAAVAFVAAGAPAFAAWQRTGSLIAAAAGETVIGLSAGLAARFVVDAAAAAGHAMGISMGLGFGAVVDPLHGSEATALSELMAFLALAAALEAGLHRDAIAWLCRSVIEAPPGADLPVATMAAQVVGEAARASAMAVRLALPVLAAVTLGHLALGILARTTPQLNLANMGFSMAVIAGGIALYLVAPTAAELTARAARAAFEGP